MVKLFKTSIVLAISVWFVFLSGCEKQAAEKEHKAPVIVSGRISPPSASKAEKKISPSPEIMAQVSKSSPPSPKTGVKEMGLNPPGAVTEALAKREQIVAVAGNADPGEISNRYDPKGRVDPFLPLLQEKEVVMPDSEEKPKRMRTPLEKLSLSQIKLVAVILMKNRQIAMVEDATGKGYEVMIGTYMGKNSGQVSKINQSSIVVKEEVKDYKGIRQEQFQEIKLHKEESGE
jgi:type IV pilus assembly protein PilP